MNQKQLLQKNREQILKIAADYGAYDIRIFGSVARGEATERSDIDFLVKMRPGCSLLDLGGFLYDVQRLLNVEVDVVTEAGLRPRIHEEIMAEAIKI